MAKQPSRTKSTGKKARKTTGTKTTQAGPGRSATKRSPTRRAARKSGVPKRAGASGSAAASRSRTTRARKTSTRPTTRASKTAPRRTTAKAGIRSRAKAGEKKPSGLGSVATAVRGSVAGAVAAVRRTISRRPTDAIVLLESDHRRLEDLFERGEKTTEGAAARRLELLGTIKAELAAHEMVEERVFYQALKSRPESRSLVLEGLEEHHAADLLVEELGGMAPDSEQWAAKFKVLQETIQHHIGEEEGEMFRTARAVLSQDELEAMGKQMKAMKTAAKKK